MIRTLTTAFVIITFPLFTGTAEALMTSHILESPNEDFKIVVYIGPINDVSFAVFYKGKMLTAASKMVFEVDEEDYLPATASFRTTAIFRIRQDEEPFLKPSKFAPSSTGLQINSVRDVKGEADYNEYIVKYSKRKDEREQRQFSEPYNPEDYENIVNIVFRAYDGGIAYRYEIATRAGETITLKNELTEFVFFDDYPCVDHSVENTPSVIAPLSKINQECFGCLSIKIPGMPTLRLGDPSYIHGVAFGFKSGRERAGTFNNLYDHHGTIDQSSKQTVVAINLNGSTVIHGTGIPHYTPWRSLVFTGTEQHGQNEVFQSLQSSSRGAADWFTNNWIR